jgi:hypothetical protein
MTIDYPSDFPLPNPSPLRQNPQKIKVVFGDLGALNHADQFKAKIIILSFVSRLSRITSQKPLTRLKV